MGSARGRAQDPTHDENDGRWGAIPEAMVESLRQRFVRFRREHKPRTRYPQILRAAVLAALRRGVAEPELRRACGLSAVQLAAWRRRELAAAQQSAMARHPARVFSVVDEVQPEVSAERSGHPVGQDVELYVGGWSGA